MKNFNLSQHKSKQTSQAIVTYPPSSLQYRPISERSRILNLKT